MDNLDNFKENEYTPELYTLMDEEGKEETFELIDIYEEGEEKYFAMVPYFENPDDLIQSDGELVILKAVTDENGEDILATIEDDDEFDRIGKIFLERIEKMYEECECDCEDDDCDCDDDDCCCHHHHE